MYCNVFVPCDYFVILISFHKKPQNGNQNYTVQLLKITLSFF